MNKNSSKYREIGFVTSARDYLITLEGLPSARIYDFLVNSEDGTKAVVTELDKGAVKAALLENSSAVPGDQYMLYEKDLTVPVGEQIFGSVLDSFEYLLREAGNSNGAAVPLTFDAKSKGIDSRKLVSDQLYTGLPVVDVLIPLGKGQRELLFGDPRSGKTSFVIDTIINQKEKGTVCIYVGLGKSPVDIARMSDMLFKKESCADYTVIVSASTVNPAPVIALAPHIALAIASYYCHEKGTDVLVVLDDLGIHAKYIREMALLSNRIPGRETYPGDIFFQHASLLERGGNFNQAYGSGSITILPVLETELSNFTGFIPTNLMSATDGHLLFDSKNLAESGYPAISVQSSVTRVGKQAQPSIAQDLSYRYQSLLADVQDLERFSRFDTELSMETQTLLHKGAVAKALLKQGRRENVEFSVQILLLSLVFTNFFETRDTLYVKKNKKNLLERLRTHAAFADVRESYDSYTLDELSAILNEKTEFLE